MAATAQKIQAKGTIPVLNALTQVVIPAATLGLRLQGGSRPPITSALVEKGAKFDIDEATGALTIYNDSPENLANVRFIVFSDHTSERDNKADIVPPAPIPYAGPAIGASIPSADLGTATSALAAAGRIQNDLLFSSLGAALVMDGANAGRFTIAESGVYRIRSEVQAKTDNDGAASNTLRLIQDPAGAANPIVERRALSTAIDDPCDMALEEVISVDAADPAAERTFEFRMVASAGTGSLGFDGQTGRVSHVVIERIG